MKHKLTLSPLRPPRFLLRRFVSSILPVLIRFLAPSSFSFNQDCKTISLSLLRLALPGMFVRLREAGGGALYNIMARLAKDQLLRCLPCIVTDEEDHISQYGLLLLSELCGATGNVYGTGVRSVWTDVTSIITRLERGEEGEKLGLVKVLMEKMKEGGRGGGKTLSNCLRLMLENGYKENFSSGGSIELCDVVKILLERGFARGCCESLSAAIVAGDASACLGWLNCIKCLLCVVTSSIPSNAQGEQGGPLESPPPMGKDGMVGQNAWGSQILSPGELQRQELKTPEKGRKGEGRKDFRICRKCVEDVASFGNLFASVMVKFDIESSARDEIEDVSSWILSAIATLAGKVFFGGILDFRGQSEGCLECISKILQEKRCRRSTVRALRVLNLGEGTILRVVMNNVELLSCLRRLASENENLGEENGKEAVLLATQLLNKAKFAQRS